jgi:hypothetical protein
VLIARPGGPVPAEVLRTTPARRPSEDAATYSLNGESQIPCISVASMPFNLETRL